MCRIDSAERGEPLSATAPDGRSVVVVLEDESRWGSDALATAELSDAVRARLVALGEDPTVKVLLARGARVGAGPRRLWIARGLPGEEVLWCWHLDRVDDLLDLPLEGLIAGREEGPAAAGPLVLVCTHGQRDRCCATLGAPVFAALEALAPGHVMRCSHLGGHRFAATALVLPDGVMYGRLRPDDAAPLLAAVRDRRIVALDQLRGRACWTRPVQAALHQWRLDSGELRYDAVHVLGRIRIGADRWRVALSTVGSGPAYCEYEVTEVEHDRSVQKSCGDAARSPARVRVARRVG